MFATLLRLLLFLIVLFKVKQYAQRRNSVEDVRNLRNKSCKSKARFL